MIKYQAWEAVLARWINMTMWNGKWRTECRQSVLFLQGSLVRNIKLVCFLSESVHATSLRLIYKNQSKVFGLVDYGFACLSRTWYWNRSPERILKNAHTHTCIFILDPVQFISSMYCFSTGKPRLYEIPYDLSMQND